MFNKSARLLVKRILMLSKCTVQQKNFDLYIRR